MTQTANALDCRKQEDAPVSRVGTNEHDNGKMPSRSQRSGIRGIPSVKWSQMDRKINPARDRTKMDKLSGLLYPVVIVTGPNAKLVLRGPLIDQADANGTSAAILAAPGQFRLAIAAEPVTALAFLDLNGHGYDLGLVFVGVNSILKAGLVWRLALFAKALGVGLAFPACQHLLPWPKC